MIKRQLVLLAFILPFLAAMVACNQKNGTTENTTEPQIFQQFSKQDVDAPKDEKAPNTTGTVDNNGLNKNSETFKQKSDVTQVNYNEPNQDFNTQDKRMIIRSGTMSVEVDKYDDTESRIKQIVNSVNGYVTNSTSNLNTAGKKQGTITIRVASGKFDDLISELSKIGKVMNENISGKDVTEEYMDADARVKTQRELESRLLKLLAEKTASLTSVVEVEQKLAAVRENIERTEGRMKYLKDQASYSTLAVSVYEPSMVQTSTGGGFFYELGESVKRGLKGFTSVLSGIITTIIALSPILAILGLVGYLIVRYIKKRKLVKA